MILSIITTFYNSEKFIRQSMESICNQKLNNDIEYILVNDASTDKSLNIVEDTINKYKNSHIKFKLINLDKNVGCGAARKIGIESATGNLFMFLDADDYYLRLDFVNDAIETIKCFNADIIEYSYIYNSNNGTRIKSTGPASPIKINDKHAAMMYMFDKNYIKVNVWNKIYTRKIIQSFKYSEEREFEDVRTIPIWISNADTIVIVPEIEINYRATKNSIIRKNSIETRLGTIKAMTSLFEKFKNDRDLLKAIYKRCMIDMEEILVNKNSLYNGYDEMNKYNTYMLSYIYPKKFKEMTYNI